MATPSTESVRCQVFLSGENAREYGKGGTWYRWKEGPIPSQVFPQDVESVMIVMPINWDECGVAENGICCEWAVSRPNANGAQWKLTGTFDKPTLSPSLHWVGMWHGWLRDGELTSCWPVEA